MLEIGALLPFLVLAGAYICLWREMLPLLGAMGSKMHSWAQLVILLSAMVLAPAGAFHSLPGVPRLRVAAGPQRGGALVVWQAGPAHSTPRRKAKLFLALDEGDIDWAALEPLEDATTPRQRALHERRRERALNDLEQLFEARIARVAPALVEALNAGPGAVAVADNVLGLDHCKALRREAVAVAEQGLLRGSASAYSTAPPETFEEKYGDEPGISASVLTPGTIAGELSPRCHAYTNAASRVLSRALGSARRGALLHEEPTDHQLRLTTVAQQVHMDNAFDGRNRRLVTTLYYLNPDWESSHGGRFLPWPCSDASAAARARAAGLPSTILSFKDLPPDAQAQIPAHARASTRLRISRKLAPAVEFEAVMAREGRHPQAPVEPFADRLVAFYSDELMHSVEPVGAPPLVREGKSLRVSDAGRFAISLWLPGQSQDSIAAVNPAHTWLAKLRESGVDTEELDPIGGTLFIEQADKANKADADAGRQRVSQSGKASQAHTGFGGAGGAVGGGKKARKKKKK